MTLKIGIFGISGRMGQMICETTYEKKFHISGGNDISEKKDFPFSYQGTQFDIPLYQDKKTLCDHSDVLIDFTIASALQDNLNACIAAKKPIVIGTTGMNNQFFDILRSASESIPIVQSENMSIGINILSVLVEKTAHILDEEWDIEIIESHHRHKVDSPSGTAYLLGRSAAAGRQKELADLQNLERQSSKQIRNKGEIGFSTIRSGGVIGDHDVSFGHENEMITVSHRAHNRKIFAQGAVYAAEKLVTMPTGLYSMKDILSLNHLLGEA